MRDSDPTSMKNIVVLLVQQDVVLSYLLTEVLEEAGFVVRETFNTQDAIQALKSQPDINAVIVEFLDAGTEDDVTLPEAIGLQFPRIPLFVTGVHISIDSHLPPGVIGLPKPFEIAVITALIRQAVNDAMQN